MWFVCGHGLMDGAIACLQLNPAREYFGSSHFSAAKDYHGKRNNCATDARYNHYKKSILIYDGFSVTFPKNIINGAPSVTICEFSSQVCK
jgi:hypothetical protein